MNSAVPLLSNYQFRLILFTNIIIVVMIYVKFTILFLLN